MKILGLIPARGGSKGIPGKNIKILGKKPLIQYTIESAKKSENLDFLITSSDDDQIIETVQKLGVEAPFKRPGKLAEDHTSSLAVIKHALNYFVEREIYYDAICLLQPTTPFRKNGLIDEAIKRFTDNDFDSLITVRQVPQEFNPHWIFKNVDGHLKLATGEKQIISRRQELPTAYHRDGAIYLIKTDVIVEQNSLFGQKIGFIDTTQDPYVNIDTVSDWQKAEGLLKRYNF
ncbi:cytidylyltransferase domain-containing protein [Christiangramia portivictoriae]|uniref:acylneuraminate cytidylyltransferase family protein n=1 Tax=Christiangramia portivictoriae TaxID=326069 RepID=UPI0004018A6A|nr:acylneuraminate cytidylyltransferase family protein [Christiangramia portivictoriae]